MSVVMVHWHVLSARAVVEGNPSPLLDWPVRVLLAYVEGVLRQDEKQAKELDRLWRPKATRAESRDERAAQIAEFVRRNS